MQTLTMPALWFLAALAHFEVDFNHLLGLHLPFGFFDWSHLWVLTVLVVAFRKGPYAGALFTLMSALPAFIIVAIWPEGAGFQILGMHDRGLWHGLGNFTLVFGDDLHVTVKKYSVDVIIFYVMLACAVGIFRRDVDRRLSAVGTSLTELMATSRQPSKSKSLWWMRRLIDRLTEPQDNGVRSAPDSAGLSSTEPVRPLVMWRNLSKLVVPLALATLQVSLPTGPFQISLVPLFLFAGIIWIYAFEVGFRAAWVLTVLAWSVGAILFENFRIFNGVSQLPLVSIVGILLGARLSSGLGTIYRTDERRSAVQKAFSDVIDTSRSVPPTKENFPARMVVMAVFASVGLWIEIGFRVSILPYFLLFGIAAYGGCRWEAFSTSNRLAALMLVCTVFNGWSSDVFSLRFIPTNFTLLLLLALVPVFSSRMQLTDIRSARFLARLFLLSAFVGTALSGGQFGPVGFALDRSTSYFALCVPVTVALFELTAIVLQRVAVKTLASTGLSSTSSARQGGNT